MQIRLHFQYSIVCSTAYGAARKICGFDQDLSDIRTTRLQNTLRRVYGRNIPDSTPDGLRDKIVYVKPSSQAGASLAYRIDEGRWQLYSAPFQPPTGVQIEAKAVRYGFAESEMISIVVP